LYDAPLKMIQGQTASKDVGSFIKLNKYVCALDGHDIIGYIIPELMACVFNNRAVNTYPSEKHKTVFQHFISSYHLIKHKLTL